MWQRAETTEVQSRLERDLKTLHPQHRHALERALIPPRRVPVADSPGESVVVVAVLNGKLLYWSDVEDGWELEEQDPEGGGVQSRGCNQFELTHIAHQAFGAPNAG